MGLRTFARAWFFFQDRLEAGFGLREPRFNLEGLAIRRDCPIVVTLLPQGGAKVGVSFGRFRIQSDSFVEASDGAISISAHGQGEAKPVVACVVVGLYDDSLTESGNCSVEISLLEKNDPETD